MFLLRQGEHGESDRQTPQQTANHSVIKGSVLYSQDPGEQWI